MSATAVRATASPAYQPRSFRPSSPFPSSSGNNNATGSSSSSGNAGRSLTPRLDYPLPSRPVSPMPPSQTPRLGADRISLPSGSSSGSGSGSVDPYSPAAHLHQHLNRHDIHGAGSSSGSGTGSAMPSSAGMSDRKGSSLRNEVTLSSAPNSPRRKPVPPPIGGQLSPTVKRKRSHQDTERAGASGDVEEGEVLEITAEMKRNASDILKLLSSLPAPLPEDLPPTFLPTPRPTPSPSPESFAAYARALSASTSPRSATSSSLGKRRRSSSPRGAGSGAFGLGLGLVDSSSSKKIKMRAGGHVPGGVAMTPTTSSFGSKVPNQASVPAPAGLSLSPELKRRSSGDRDRKREMMEGKETWSKARWASAAASYKTRAVLLKRHGDAHLRLTGAKPQFLHLPADTLLGLLSLTDAVLLWLYAYWCDEQAEGRVRMTPYRESQALRDFVRGEWERYVRKGWSEDGNDEGAGDDESGGREAKKEMIRDMGRGMIGLMYLIEAVVYYHLSAEQLHHLNKRSAQINALATSATSPSAAMAASHSANGTHDGGHAALPRRPSGASMSHTGNINAASNNNASPTNSSGESPSNNSIGPSPHSASSSQQHPEIPMEIMNLITTSASQSARASSNLLNSRHHLSLSLLRHRFPSTYDLAISSELSDEALPPPNDPLGAARKVDIDQLDRFIWPIELGMCAPLAHLAVFGRGLVAEMAQRIGKDWDTRLGATSV